MVGKMTRTCRLVIAAYGSNAAKGVSAKPSGRLRKKLDRQSSRKRKPYPRGPMDDIFIKGLIFQHRGHLIKAGVALLVCVACNLASPVVAGTLFELLVGRQAGNAKTYGKVFGIMASLYIVEPLLTRVYIQNICTLSEKVLATLRAELFRSLLLQKIEFFDVHTASKLTNLISTELDSVRSFVFRNVSRDRGPRAVLEGALY